MKKLGYFTSLFSVPVLFCLTLFLLSPFSLPKTKQKTNMQHYFVVSLFISLKRASSQYLFHYRQEERRRRSFQDYTGQKITLEAVLNTTCKKCGCKGKVKPLPFPSVCPCGCTLYWIKEAAQCECCSPCFLAKWWPHLFMLLFQPDTLELVAWCFFCLLFWMLPCQILYHYHHSPHPIPSRCPAWARSPWTMSGGVSVLDYD